MNSRLNSIKNWSELAKAANYNCQNLARLCHVSPDQLRRWFQQVTGRSAKQWMRDERLQDSPDALEVTGQVKGAAYKLRFKNPSHFSREYKRVYGIPPSGRCPGGHPPPLTHAPRLEKAAFRHKSRFSAR